MIRAGMLAELCVHGLLAWIAVASQRNVQASGDVANRDHVSLDSKVRRGRRPSQTIFSGSPGPPAIPGSFQRQINRKRSL